MDTLSWVSSSAEPHIKEYAASEAAKAEVITEAIWGASFSVARVVVIFGGPIVQQQTNELLVENCPDYHSTLISMCENTVEVALLIEWVISCRQYFLSLLGRWGREERKGGHGSNYNWLKTVQIECFKCFRFVKLGRPRNVPASQFLGTVFPLALIEFQDWPYSNTRDLSGGSSLSLFAHV